MSTVVAAIDNSAAADPVLRTALAVAQLTGAEVVSIHVVETDARNARTAASFCGVPPHELTGDVVEQLVAAASQADVELLVVGARGRRLGARPAGHVTLELMTLVAKPLVLVPSQARVPDRIGRLLELDRRSPVGARGVTGSPITTLAVPRRTKRRPALRIERVPRIATGTTGMPAAAAVANAPMWNGRRPGIRDRRPSGKKTSVRPARAALMRRVVSAAPCSRSACSTNSTAPGCCSGSGSAWSSVPPSTTRAGEPRRRSSPTRQWST